MGQLAVGHLRLVPNEAAPLAATAGDGSSGSGGSDDISTWTIVDDAPALIDGERRVLPVAGWRAGRVIGTTNGPIEAIPDWLCEPAERDRAAQLARHAGRGIGHVWLLDQSARTIEVYRLTRDRWTHVATAAGDARLRAEPFQAIELDLSYLWHARS